MQDGMLCLDSYALVEIVNGNNNYSNISSFEYVIPVPVLAEYFLTVFKHSGEKEAARHIDLFKRFSVDVPLDIWIKSMVYRHEHKAENLSVFDCIGYIFAQENNLKFVTGDKQFKNKKGVMFVKNS